MKTKQGEQQRREASGGGKNALEEKKIFYAEKVGALLSFLGENLLEIGTRMPCCSVYTHVHMNVYISIVIIVKRESWRGRRGRT